jgi:hypothetical protein
MMRVIQFVLCVFLAVSLIGCSPQRSFSQIPTNCGGGNTPQPCTAQDWANAQNQAAQYQAQQQAQQQAQRDYEAMRQLQLLQQYNQLMQPHYVGPAQSSAPIITRCQLIGQFGECLSQ